MRYLFLFLLTFSLFSSNIIARSPQKSKALKAESQGIPPEIIDGIKFLQKDQIALGIKKWSSISILEDYQFEFISNDLYNIKNEKGQFLGYELVKFKTISKSYHKIFLLIRYEKAPILFQFDTYSKNGDEKYVILALQIHQNLHVKLPPL